MRVTERVGFLLRVLRVVEKLASSESDLAIAGPHSKSGPRHHRCRLQRRLFQLVAGIGDPGSGRWLRRAARCRGRGNGSGRRRGNTSCGSRRLRDSGRRRNVRGARSRRAAWRTGGRSGRRSWGSGRHCHQFPPQTTVAGTALCVQNPQNKSQNEKNPGQPAGEFREHIGRLRTKNILSDPPTKGCAEALAFRPLHQNDQCHQNRNQHVDGEENVDKNVHCERTISAGRAACKRPTRRAVLRAPECRAANLTALSRQVPGEVLSLKSKNMIRSRIKSYRAL